jgi:hypothetical protein
MRPKAAATPTATTPEPYSRPIAIIVAAAALELEEDAAVEEVLAAVAEALAELELELVVTAVKSVRLRCPQFAASFCLQTFWAAASFWPAVIQLEKICSQMKVGMVPW